MVKISLAERKNQEHKNGKKDSENQKEEGD
jgi:hypothetical protein